MAEILCFSCVNFAPALDPNIAKAFIGGCRLCPYMKLNSLEKVRDALRAPSADQVILLDEDIRRRAARCIERMFELAPTD